MINGNLIRDGITSINTALMAFPYERVSLSSDQLRGCLPITSSERMGISTSGKVCFLKYYTMEWTRELSKLSVTAYFSWIKVCLYFYDHAFQVRLYYHQARCTWGVLTAGLNKYPAFLNYEWLKLKLHYIKILKM